MLLDREGLTRQESLVDEAIVCREQPAIARHDVSGFKLNDVTGHQPIDGNFAAASIAERLRRKPHGAAKRVNGILGPALLHDIENNAQKDNDDDDDEARHLPGPGREAARKEQDENERIGKAVENLSPERTATVN